MRRTSNKLNVGLAGERPWERAAVVSASLDRKAFTSAWVIIEAHEVCRLV